MYEKQINLLATIAEDNDAVSNARVAAMVFYKGSVISIGFNQNKSHPFAAKYSRHPDAIYLHAETDAILKAKKRLSDDELKKATLIICRRKYEENGSNILYGLAKPCCGCAKCIAAHEIKKVVYTLDSDDDELRYEVCIR